MKNTPDITSADSIEVAPHNFTHNGDEVLILRRTGKDRKAKNNFIYPRGVGQVVTAPDFSPENSCGGGLHGWPWGFGLGEGSDYDLDDVWLVMGAKPADVVGELEGGYKCKVRTATIRYDGDFAGAMAMLRDGFHACVIEMAKMPVSSGAKSSKAVDDKNSSKSAQSGDSSKSAQSGDYSKSAQSGYSSNSAQSGYSSNSAQSGDSSNSAQSGYSSKSAQSGDYSKSAQSGHSSKSAQSGDSSKSAQSGDYSQSAQSGKNCVAAIATANGKIKTGPNGAFALAYFISEEAGWDFVVGKVGRDGVKAGTWYKVEDGKLVEVTE